MKIAVLALSRMGDILLSHPLLDRLAELNPDCDIHLIVPKSFAAVGMGLGVDCVHTINNDRLILKAAEQSPHLELYKEVQLELNDLLNIEFDQVMNLGYDTLSSIISYMLQGEVVAGQYLDAQGQRRIATDWARMTMTSHLARGLNPFHLADLQKGFAGSNSDTIKPLHFSIPDEANENAISLLRESGVQNDNSPLVVIQVGASHPSKRWDEESFGRTARLLQESVGATTIFCGIPSEAPLVEMAMRFAGDKAINLVGQTDIPTLAAVLKSANLVISNDTGTMHLAQAVGTPVLCLTLGNALSQETGPYGDGNLLVEPQLACYPCDFQVQCPHFNCHRSFSPTLIARLAKDMLENRIPDNYEIEDETVIISRTAFDQKGFWQLKRLSGYVNRMDTLRNRYRSTLSDRFGIKNETEFEATETIVLSPQDRVISTGLCDVGMRGEHISATLLNLVQADPNPEDISALAGQIDDLQDQVLNGFLQADFLHPLLALFRFELENLSDSDAIRQVTGTQAAFKRLATSVTLLTQSDNECEERSAAINEPIETRELLEDIPREANPSSLYDRFRRPRFRADRLTVILLESDYYLQGEIRAALLRMGHRVLSIRYLESGNVIEQLLLASMQADLLITVNHLGFDEDGELANLLEKIELPYVSWFADRPQYILLDHNAAAGEMAHLFTWERLTIPELIGYGFERVEYLPLATDETAFSSHSAKNEPLRGPCWVANSMVEPVIEWERRANVRSTHEPVLSMAVEDLLDTRSDPWDALNGAIKQHPVLTRDWTQGDKLRMATLVAFRATREDRKRIVRVCQPLGLEVVGDEGWKELAPDLKLLDPINYGPELSRYYANSIQLNSTSYQMPSSVNQRVFDVPCAGGILLTDEQDDIHGLFDAETECITYRTPEEAREKIVYLLSHQDLAMKISEKARRRILAEHTYTQRLQTILDVVRQQHTCAHSV